MKRSFKNKSEEGQWRRIVAKHVQANHNLSHCNHAKYSHSGNRRRWHKWDQVVRKFWAKSGDLLGRCYIGCYLPLELPPYWINLPESRTK